MVSAKCNAMDSEACAAATPCESAVAASREKAARGQQALCVGAAVDGLGSLKEESAEEAFSKVRGFRVAACPFGSPLCRCDQIDLRIDAETEAAVRSLQTGAESRGGDGDFENALRFSRELSWRSDALRLCVNALWATLPLLAETPEDAASLPQSFACKVRSKAEMRKGRRKPRLWPASFGEAASDAPPAGQAKKADPETDRRETSASIEASRFELLLGRCLYAARTLRSLCASGLPALQLAPLDEPQFCLLDDAGSSSHVEDFFSEAAAAEAAAAVAAATSSRNLIKGRVQLDGVLCAALPLQAAEPAGPACLLEKALVGILRLATNAVAHGLGAEVSVHRELTRAVASLLLLRCDGGEGLGIGRDSGLSRVLRLTEFAFREARSSWRGRRDLFVKLAFLEDAVKVLADERVVCARRQRRLFEAALLRDSRVAVHLLLEARVAFWETPPPEESHQTQTPSGDSEALLLIPLRRQWRRTCATVFAFWERNSREAASFAASELERERRQTQTLSFSSENADKQHNQRSPEETALSERPSLLTRKTPSREESGLCGVCDATHCWLASASFPAVDVVEAFLSALDSPNFDKLTKALVSSLEEEDSALGMEEERLDAVCAEAVADACSSLVSLGEVWTVGEEAARGKSEGREESLRLSATATAQLERTFNRMASSLQEAFAKAAQTLSCRMQVEAEAEREWAVLKVMRWIHATAPVFLQPALLFAWRRRWGVQPTFLSTRRLWTCWIEDSRLRSLCFFLKPPLPSCPTLREGAQEQGASQIILDCLDAALSSSNASPFSQESLNAVEAAFCALRPLLGLAAAAQEVEGRLAETPQNVDSLLGMRRAKSTPKRAAPHQLTHSKAQRRKRAEKQSAATEAVSLCDASSSQTPVSLCEAAVAGRALGEGDSSPWLFQQPEFEVLRRRVPSLWLQLAKRKAQVAVATTRCLCGGADLAVRTPGESGEGEALRRPKGNPRLDAFLLEAASACGVESLATPVAERLKEVFASDTEMVSAVAHPRKKAGGVASLSALAESETLFWSLLQVLPAKGSTTALLALSPLLNDVVAATLQDAEPQGLSAKGASRPECMHCSTGAAASLAWSCQASVSSLLFAIDAEDATRSQGEGEGKEVSPALRLAREEALRLTALVKWNEELAKALSLEERLGNERGRTEGVAGFRVFRRESRALLQGLLTLEARLKGALLAARREEKVSWICESSPAVSDLLTRLPLLGRAAALFPSSCRVLASARAVVSIVASLAALHDSCVCQKEGEAETDEQKRSSRLFAQVEAAARAWSVRTLGFDHSETLASVDEIRKALESAHLSGVPRLSSSQRRLSVRLLILAARIDATTSASPIASKMEEPSPTTQEHRLRLADAENPAALGEALNEGRPFARLLKAAARLLDFEQDRDCEAVRALAGGLCDELLFAVGGEVSFASRESAVGCEALARASALLDGFCVCSLSVEDSFGLTQKATPSTGGACLLAKTGIHGVLAEAALPLLRSLSASPRHQSGSIALAVEGLTKAAAHVLAEAAVFEAPFFQRRAKPESPHADSALSSSAVSLTNRCVAETNAQDSADAEAAALESTYTGMSMQRRGEARAFLQSHGRLLRFVFQSLAGALLLPLPSFLLLRESSSLQQLLRLLRLALFVFIPAAMDAGEAAEAAAVETQVQARVLAGGAGEKASVSLEAACEALALLRETLRFVLALAKVSRGAAFSGRRSGDRGVASVVASFQLRRPQTRGRKGLTGEAEDVGGAGEKSLFDLLPPSPATASSAKEAAALIARSCADAGTWLFERRCGFRLGTLLQRFALQQLGLEDAFDEAAGAAVKAEEGLDLETNAEAVGLSAEETASASLGEVALVVASGLLLGVQHYRRDRRLREASLNFRETLAAALQRRRGKARDSEEFSLEDVDETRDSVERFFEQRRHRCEEICWGIVATFVRPWTNAKAEALRCRVCGEAIDLFADSATSAGEDAPPSASITYPQTSQGGPTSVGRSFFAQLPLSYFAEQDKCLQCLAKKAAPPAPSWSRASTGSQEQRSEEASSQEPPFTRAVTLTAPPPLGASESWAFVCAFQMLLGCCVPGSAAPFLFDAEDGPVRAGRGDGCSESLRVFERDASSASATAAVCAAVASEFPPATSVGCCLWNAVVPHRWKASEKPLRCSAAEALWIAKVLSAAARQQGLVGSLSSSSAFEGVVTLMGPYFCNNALEGNALPHVFPASLMHAPPMALFHPFQEALLSVKTSSPFLRASASTSAAASASTTAAASPEAPQSVCQSQSAQGASACLPAISTATQGGGLAEAGAGASLFASLCASLLPPPPPQTLEPLPTSRLPRIALAATETGQQLLFVCTEQLRLLLQLAPPLLRLLRRRLLAADFLRLAAAHRQALWVKEQRLLREAALEATSALRGASANPSSPTSPLISTTPTTTTSGVLRLETALEASGLCADFLRIVELAAPTSPLQNPAVAPATSVVGRILPRTATAAPGGGAAFHAANATPVAEPATAAAGAAGAEGRDSQPQMQMQNVTTASVSAAAPKAPVQQAGSSAVSSGPGSNASTSAAPGRSGGRTKPPRRSVRGP